MPLNPEYRQQLNESLDLDQGGRLHAIAQKATAVDAPVLIIGLGGTGVDALLITKKLIHDTIASEKKQDGTYSDKPKNIEYLAIDTDPSYDKAYRGIRLRKENNEFMLYTQGDVTPILKHPEMQPPYVRNWLNTNITTKSVISGAGAVRQLGRLMLMRNVPGLVTAVQKKVEKAVVGYPASTPMYVFYLSGIGGGTGSGTFLDTPYLVRAVARQVTSDRVIQNIGILFMPDVNTCKSAVDETKKHAIRANGFAALKELDYLMNIEHLDDKMDQSYGTVMATPPQSTPEPPYNVCLLMSSKDSEGAAFGTGDENYQMTIAVAAETVFNFVLGDDGAADVNQFSIHSFLSNETNNAITYKGILGNQRRPVSYQYSIAGASSAVLPIDDIMSYLTYKAFQQIDTYWHQRPEEPDVREVLKEFKLTKKGLEQSAKQKLRYAAVDGLKYSDIKSNPAQVKALYEAAKKSQEAAVRKNISEMTAALMAQIENKQNLINQYFLDIQRGPVFAQQCLYSTNTQVICVLNEIRNIANAFVKDMREPEEMEVLQRNAAAALQKIVNGHGILGIGTKADRDAYIEAMNKQYGAELTNIVSEQLVQYCVNAIDLLTKENNRIYEIVAELMESLVPLFEKFGAIKTDAKRTQTAGGQTLSWSLVDTPAFIEQLEKRMAANPQFAVDMTTVITNFYQYLFSNTELWAGEKKTDMVENINSFIYEQFQNILNHSMDFFLGMIAESQGLTLDQYCQQIIDKLKERAKVHFPVNRGIVAGATRPGYSFISIPNNSPKLLAAAKTAALSSVAGGSMNSIVKTSGMQDRIFMMNFESATSLSVYADMLSLYNDYKQFRDEPGRHLFAPNAYEDVDWKALPSPYPESEWIGFADEVEHQRNEEYKEVLRKALDYGYVTTTPAEGTMTLRWGAPVDYKSVLDEYKISMDATTAIPKEKVKNVRKKIALQLTGEGLDARLTESFTRSEMTTNDEKTELKQDYMEMIFIQLFAVRDKIKAMVENHEACLAALENVKTRALDDTIVSHYVECRMYGLIKKNKLQYIYLDRKGDSQILAELTPRQTAYGEHYLLEAYKNLPAKVRDNLDMRAEDMVKTTDGAESKSKLSNYSAKMIAEKLEDLQLDWRDTDNGEVLLASYHQLRDAVRDLEPVFGSGADGDDEEVF